MSESTRDKKARFRRYVWRMVQKNLDSDLANGSDWLLEDSEGNRLDETEQAIMTDAVREVMATAASRAKVIVQRKVRR